MRQLNFILLKRLQLILLAVMIPHLANAHDFEVDGIYYLINGNGATVTYRGDSSFQYSDEYTGAVNIPSTVTYDGTTYSVTEIGFAAFMNCTGLTSVAIPNSVTKILNEAFFQCSGLTSVTIGNSVTKIGIDAFSHCSGLTSVTIPNSVTTIGGGAFYSCSGLTSVTIGNSVTSIGCNVFEGTAWYNNQPDGLVYAGTVAYKYKGTMPNGTSIVLMDGCTLIADQAFFRCSGLTSVTIGNSVTKIGDDAFSQCSGLTSVTIGNSVTTIGYNAFSYCTGLTSVTIPNSVTSIGERVFSTCIGLTSIAVEEGNPKYDSRYNCNAIIETESNTLIAGCKNTIIPNSVTTIGGGAFYSCSGLTSVAIPNSVTTIGDNAFRGCTGLTSIKSKILNPDNVLMGGRVFAEVDKSNCTLNVPQGTLEIYQATPQWNDFVNIVEVPFIPGDVNDDGFVTSADVTAIYDVLLGTGNQFDNTADVNGDGVVTSADVTAIYDILLGN